MIKIEQKSAIIISGEPKMKRNNNRKTISKENKKPPKICLQKDLKILFDTEQQKFTLRYFWSSYWTHSNRNTRD